VDKTTTSTTAAAALTAPEEQTMTRGIVIVGVAGLLVGVLVGFLWWGMPDQRMQDDLRALQGQQAAAEVAREELKRTEDELRRERERRSRLEVIVSEGQK
jgi:beta-lactam-binding protein with PASTA domain